MKITPLDIRRKEFRRAVRGYSDEEVDIFLDEVADEFERLFQENIELQDRVHRLEEQAAGYAQVKEALEKTLITAQLQSEEMRANARKESELVVRDAQFKARGIVDDAYSETQKVQQTLVQLKLLEEDFRFKFRSLLDGYLRLLGEAPISAGAGAASAEPAVLLGEPVGEPVTSGAPRSPSETGGAGAGVPTAVAERMGTAPAATTGMSVPSAAALSPASAGAAVVGAAAAATTAAATTAPNTPTPPVPAPGRQKGESAWRRRRMWRAAVRS